MIYNTSGKKAKREEKNLVKVYIFYNGGCWHCNRLWTFILVYPPFDLPLHHRPSGSWCGPGRWGAALFWDETDSLFISSCQTEYCLICSFSMSSIFGQMTSAQQRLLFQSHHSQACWKSKERVMARKSIWLSWLRVHVTYMHGPTHMRTHTHTHPHSHSVSLSLLPCVTQDTSKH